MMLLKKKRALISTCALVLSILAGCASGEAAHTHTAAGAWEYNATEHWRLCECGEKVDAGEHTLNDDMICSACGSEIWDWGDGQIDLYSYTESGEPLQVITYDADGNVTYEQEYEYEYDEDGNKLADAVYENDTLLEESEYALDSDGVSYLAKWTYYQEDGSLCINEYDEYGNTLAVYLYDVDGALSTEGHYEQAIAADGSWYEAKATECYYSASGAVDAKYVCEYNEYSDILSRIKYDADDNVLFEERYEREYDADGNPLWEKTYQDGILRYEIVSYAEGADDFSGWRYPEMTIEYDENGAKKIVSEYGENTEVAKDTYYTPDGDIERELTYEYEMDDEGYWTNVKAYEGSRLVFDTEYAISAEGWNYKARVTEYHEDGTKTVTEYDENEESVSETKYDADGNEVG